MPIAFCDDFVPQRTFGNVWRLFGLPHCGAGAGATGIYWVGTRDAAEHSTIHSTVIITKHDPGHNVNGTEIEKPCSLLPLCPSQSGNSWRISSLPLLMASSNKSYGGKKKKKKASTAEHPGHSPKLSGG